MTFRRNNFVNPNVKGRATRRKQAPVGLSSQATEPASGGLGHSASIPFARSRGLASRTPAAWRPLLRTGVAGAPSSARKRANGGPGDALAPRSLFSALRAGGRALPGLSGEASSRHPRPLAAVLQLASRQPAGFRGINGRPPACGGPLPFIPRSLVWHAPSPAPKPRQNPGDSFVSRKPPPTAPGGASERNSKCNEGGRQAPATQGA